MEERRRWLQVLVPTLLVGTATVLMLSGLSQPDRIVFDETYYVNDARDMLEQGVEDGFVVHPPVGKLLIAASIRIFGDSPLGWRAVGAILGVVAVLLTYDLGRRLFRRLAPAALGALLLAVDGVFLVQARTAMLDIHLAFFVVLGAWALVVHAQRVRRADERLLAATRDAEDAPPARRTLPPRDPWMLVVAGVAFGLAVATKWSGLLALGAGGLVAIGIEVARRRRVTGRWWTRWYRAVGLLAATLVLVPALVYAASWLPWMVSFPDSYQGEQECGDGEACATPATTRVAALGRFHRAIWRYHRDLEAEHPYRAPAYTWPVLARPVVYYYETCGQDRQDRVPSTDDDGNVEVPEPCRVAPGNAAEILAVGNPALWWTFLAAGAVLVGAAVGRRDPRAAIPLVFYAGQFVPWLVVSRPVFSFYTVPIVPFVALGVAAAASRLLDRAPIGAALAGGAGGGVLGAALVSLVDLAGGDPTRAAYGLAAAGTAAIGAAAASWWDERRSPAPPRWGPGVLAPPGAAGRWAIAVIAVIAVGVAIWLLPVWLGIEMGEDAVRSRWWFRGWI